MKSDLIDIAVQVKGETQSAYRVYDGKRTEWVPKSQCEIETDCGGKSAVLTLPEWLAIEKGFI